VSVVPHTGSVRVAPDVVLKIEFSEAIDPLSVNSAVFVSPSSLKSEIKVKRRTLSVSFPDGVPQNGVVSVTVGSGLKDLRGNTLASSTTTAFTTGDEIASGNINGRIYGDKPFNGFLVGAYPVDDSLVITPDTILAPYLTQANDSGNFSLDYLTPGWYRVICWEDKNKDKLYQPGIDRIGIAGNDVELASHSAAYIEMRVAKQDTSEAIPVFLQSFDRNHLSLRFSGKIVLSEFLEKSFSIVDSSQSPLPIKSFWIDPLDSTKLIVLTELQSAELLYTARFESDTTIFEFAGSPQIDTTGPLLMKSVPLDQAKSVPVNLIGLLMFDDALSSDSLDRAITLSIADSEPTPIAPVIRQNNSLEWKTPTALPTGARCLLTIDLTKIFDTAGNVAGDTIRTIFFMTIDPAETGEVSGVITGISNSPVRVSIAKVSAQKSEPIVTSTNEEGAFFFEHLPPGEYNIWCWEDANSNGLFDPGQIDPFRYAEKFAVSQVAIVVRARWETSGLNLSLR